MLDARAEINRPTGPDVVHAVGAGVIDEAVGSFWRRVPVELLGQLFDVVQRLAVLENVGGDVLGARGSRDLHPQSRVFGIFLGDVEIGAGAGCFGAGPQADQRPQLQLTTRLVAFQDQ